MEDNNNKDLNNNFEKLCFQILELKSETLKTYESIKQYYQKCIYEHKPIFELQKLLTALSQNKKISEENIQKEKTYLTNKLNEKTQIINALQNEFNLIKDEFKKLSFGKEKMKEINKMRKSELISVQYQISILSKKIKNTQKECFDLDNKINTLTEENRSSYSTECTLLEQVMAFDKKLYNIYNAREQKIKEKHNLEIDLKSLTDSQRRKANEKINFLKEKSNNEISNLKNEINKLEKANNKINEQNNSIKNMNEFMISKLKTKTKENELNDNNEINDNTINQLNLNLIEESKKLDEDVNSMILKIKNEYKTIINIEPIQNISPLDYLNNLLSKLQNYCNDNSYEQIINQKSEEVSKLGEEISKKIYDKFLKRKFLVIFKIFVKDNKIMKEKEEKEIKELQKRNEELRISKQINQDKEEESKEKQREIELNERMKKEEKDRKNKKKKVNKKNNYKCDIESNDDEQNCLEIKNNKKKTSEFNLNSMDFLNELSRSVIQSEEDASNKQHFGRRRRNYNF